MRPTYSIYVVWYHLFQNFLHPSSRSCDQYCDYTIRYDWCDWPPLTLIPSVLKMEKWKINQKESENKKGNKKKQSSLFVILTLRL